MSQSWGRRRRDTLRQPEISRSQCSFSYPIGSMVLLYIYIMVCHGSHQYTPFMLAYIPAPWIRHGYRYPVFNDL